MGGVLFIDGTYYLYRSSDSKDYGQECIDILLQVMEMTGTSSWSSGPVIKTGLAADPQLGRSQDDLMRLEPLDILTSPVFSLSAIDE